MAPYGSDQHCPVALPWPPRRRECMLSVEVLHAFLEVSEGCSQWRGVKPGRDTVEDQIFNSGFDHARLAPWPDDLGVPGKVLPLSVPVPTGLLQREVDPVLGGLLMEDPQLAKVVVVSWETEGNARLQR